MKKVRHMKQTFAVIVTVFLAAGCGSGGDTTVITPSSEKTSDATSTPVVSNTVTDNRKNSSSDSFSDTDFETEGYLYENSIGDSMYFVTVKNNSNAVVMVDGNAVAKDSEGKSIGADSMSIAVIGPGETSIGYFFFDSVSEIDSVEYQLSYSKQNSYKPVISSLEVSQVLNEKNITVTVTNKGDINAQFVEGHALFFNSDNEVIAYTSQYITDRDSEIKPGSTLSAQFDNYGISYDYAKVFFTGRSDGKRSEVSSAISDDDFIVNAYQYDNSIGDTVVFMTIQNGSGQDVAVTVNATAYDASGNTIGADNGSIEVIGSDQTSVCNFYFAGVTGIDHLEYQYFYGTDLYYEDVLHDLFVETTVNSSNVIVSVTNNGEKPAQFVEAYALFFNEDHELVYVDTTYFTDSDSEIKAGATLTKQLDAYNTFSTVEVYLSGRRSKR